MVPAVVSAQTADPLHVVAAVLSLMVTVLAASLARASHPLAAATALLFALGLLRVAQDAWHLAVGVLAIAIVGEVRRRTRSGDLKRSLDGWAPIMLHLASRAGLRYHCNRLDSGRNEWAFLRKLADLRILIPILLTLSILTFLLSLSNVRDVAHLISGLPPSTILLAFGLAVIYLAGRTLLFSLLLGKLRISSTWREKVLALVIGEMAITIPAGEYAQNWVLKRIENADFSRSSAATTFMLFTTGFLGLSTLALLGNPGLGWLRPFVIALFLAAAALVTALIRVKRVRAEAYWLMHAGPMKTIGPELLETIEGLRELFTPGVVARALLITGFNLFFLLLAFYLVAHGVGLVTLTFRQGVTTYLFAITIGFVEAGGLTALQGWGFGLDQALAALLAFRLVWTASVWLICGLTIFLLRSEFSHQQPL